MRIVRPHPKTEWVALPILVTPITHQKNRSDVVRELANHADPMGRTIKYSAMKFGSSKMADCLRKTRTTITRLLHVRHPGQRASCLVRLAVSILTQLDLNVSCRIGCTALTPMPIGSVRGTWTHRTTIGSRLTN